MPGGYVGRTLRVNLSTGTIESEPLPSDLCRDSLGGYGFGARYLIDEQEPGVAPLSPGNILGFITGPLTGTPAILGTRYSVVGKSPLTGGWGDANSGGYFGPGLKLPMHDPRLTMPFLLGYLLDATPARHNQGSAALIDMPETWTALAGAGISSQEGYEGKANEHVKLANLMHVINASGLCNFGVCSFVDRFILPEFMEAVVGWTLSSEDLFRMALGSAPSGWHSTSAKASIPCRGRPRIGSWGTLP